MKILIADDNIPFAEVIKEVIEQKSNYTILNIAKSSQEQIQLMNQYNFDIIITDNIRKEENITGLDIILKSLNDKRKEKYILITAMSKINFIDKKTKELPQNVIGFLEKPFFEYDKLIEYLKLAENVIKNTTP